MTSDAHLIRLITYRWWLTIATLTFPKTETKPWLHNLLTRRAIFLNNQTQQVSFLFFFATWSGLLLSLTVHHNSDINTPEKKIMATTNV
jgi:hypothetical protein